MAERDEAAIGASDAAARPAIATLLERLWREHVGALRAALLRRFRDLDRVDEAASEAFAAALRSWPEQGVPARPLHWLIATANHRAIDALRRRARDEAALAELAARMESGEWRGAASREAEPGDALEAEGPLGDDTLRLLFACCHPALAPEAQLALMLREVAGLATEEIARAFLVAPATLAQRIVRAKARLREVGATFERPEPAELPVRLAAVLRAIYLLFNEGYFASRGVQLQRVELAAEALRLARLVAELTDEPEAEGLLALLLLQEARRAARVDAAGALVPLEEQERSRVDRALLAEGVALLERAFASRRFGPFTLQAAIAALHAEASSHAATDWAQIVALYDLLLRCEPTPLVALNRAIAVGQCDGPAAALALLESLRLGGALDGYAPFHAAQGDACRRLGRLAEARGHLERALARAVQEPERHHYERRLRELASELPKG
ncbi:MAG: RNA polymerase subunit sigma-24 [Planctomycetes bacterium]|nr:RNA polymerase subunit sigma-24 [Planctomycetota bacterium]